MRISMLLQFSIGARDKSELKEVARSNVHSMVVTLLTSQADKSELKSELKAVAGAIQAYTHARTHARVHTITNEQVHVYALMRPYIYVSIRKHEQAESVV